MQVPTTEGKFLPQTEPSTQTLRSNSLAWLAALVIGTIAIVPRCVGLADFFTIDEPYHWIARVRLFAEALSAHNWAATDITGHPGVTTMWLGALGRWLGARMGVHDLGGVGAGAVYLASLRLPLALVNGLAVPMGYLALRRLVRPSVALLAGLLWATSPYLVAHGRLLHLDALLTSFMTLSVLLLLVAIEQKTKNKEQNAGQDSFVLCSLFSVLGSGVCAGLALLTKAPSLFLLPFAGLIFISDWQNSKSAIDNPSTARFLSVSKGRAGLQSAMRRYLLWLGVAVLVVLMLWPALWVAPFMAIGDVANEIIGNGGTPEPAGNFFRGQSVAAPGWLYYPAVLALRTTPLTLIGLALLPFTYFRFQISDFRLRRSGAIQNQKSENENRTVLALLAFVLLFGLMMSIEPKKFDRYLLPIWPAIEILAAIGLVALVDQITAFWHTRTKNKKQNTKGQPISFVLYSLFFVLTAANLAYYHPYYLAYYNPLLGGGATAQRTMLVGWGEGMEQIGAWLRGRPDLKRGPVLSWIPPTLMPFVPASPGVLDLRVPLMTKPSSYAVLYSRSVQRKESAIAEAYVRQVPPLYTLLMYGIEYASVYQLPRPFDVPLDAHFGDGLHLRGFSLERAGGTLTITPSWDIQTDQPGGRFCFVHVLAPDGRRVAQVDAPIDQGMFPAWQAGQQFDPPFPLQLPADLPAEQYRVVMGVYTLDGGRLPLHSGPAAPADLDGPDALLVTTLSLP